MLIPIHHETKAPRLRDQMTLGMTHPWLHPNQAYTTSQFKCHQFLRQLAHLHNAGIALVTS